MRSQPNALVVVDQILTYVSSAIQSISPALKREAAGGDTPGGYIKGVGEDLVAIRELCNGWKEGIPGLIKSKREISVDTNRD